MLLYDAIESVNKNVKNIDKKSLSKLLESEETQAAMRKSALEYSAKFVENNGMARGLFADESYCDNSWLYWLPWTDCPEPERTGKQTLTLIKEQSYKCYEPK